MTPRRLSRTFLALLPVLILTGCSTAHYRNSADREVYGILTAKELRVLGRTNALTVDTAYSARQPGDIPSMELIEQQMGGGNTVHLTLPEALKRAVAHDRQYQFRKEQLYLTALTLTLRRHDFAAKPFGSLGAGAERERDKDLKAETGGNRIGFNQALKSGGTISASIANDMVRYFTGDPRRSITTVMSLNFAQPLLRGFGPDVAAENLTQAERDVVYEIRNFALFQQTFTVGVVTTYYRLLQRKDAVRNAYNNYTRLRRSREMLEALARDRMPRFQVDQALQQELAGQNAYIRAVQSYQNSLDQFKVTLGLPLGTHITLDDGALSALQQTGLQLIEMSDQQGYQLAVNRKFDLLNEIDRFEDSKRKIIVAADRLRANLTFVSAVSLQNEATDYANFDPGNFQTSAGLQLDLPFDRLAERNAYRTSQINFERQLRTLAITLDNARDAVREGLRNLEQLRQSYAIQTNALALATRRANITPQLVQAGRAQIRDQLEAESALLSAQNAVTQVVVDYLDARLKFLIDLGVLQMDPGDWWLRKNELAGGPATDPVPAGGPPAIALPLPDEVFDGTAIAK